MEIPDEKTLQEFEYLTGVTVKQWVDMEWRRRIGNETRRRTRPLKSLGGMTWHSQSETGRRL